MFTRINQTPVIKPVRSVVLLFLAAAVSGLAACLRPPDCFSEKVFCAALVTDTLGLDDHGPNQDAWAGLSAAGEDGLADRIEYIESVDPRDYEKNIAYFVKNGFDVIVTSGAGLRDETLNAAQGDPGTVFIGINQAYEEEPTNLLSITFAEDQIGFAAGVLAARLTRTRITGAVCETQGIDPMWRTCEGFRAGVRSIDRKINVQVIYNDNGDSEKLFMDETWGYETGRKLIQRGADVIFAAGGGTGEGALRAAAEAQVNAIGTERDQAAVLGGSGSSVVTSILGGTNPGVREALRMLREGNSGRPGPGLIRYVPLNQKFPVNITQELDALLLQFLNGELKTGVPAAKP